MAYLVISIYLNIGWSNLIVTQAEEVIYLGGKVRSASHLDLIERESQAKANKVEKLSVFTNDDDGSDSSEDKTFSNSTLIDDGDDLLIPSEGPSNIVTQVTIILAILFGLIVLCIICGLYLTFHVKVC